MQWAQQPLHGAGCRCNLCISQRAPAQPAVLASARPSPPTVAAAAPPLPPTAVNEQELAEALRALEELTTARTVAQLRAALLTAMPLTGALPRLADAVPAARQRLKVLKAAEAAEAAAATAAGARVAAATSAMAACQLAAPSVPSVPAAAAARELVPAPAAAASDDDQVCVVCLDKPRTHAFLPCGHRCACEVCHLLVLRGARTAASGPSCPICRSVVYSAMHVIT